MSLNQIGQIEQHKKCLVVTHFLEIELEQKNAQQKVAKINKKIEFFFWNWKFDINGREEWEP